MLKFMKFALLTLSIGLAGCGTVSKAEYDALERKTRADNDYKVIIEGRIKEARIGKPPRDIKATDTAGLMTKSDTLQGVFLVAGVLDLVEKSKDVMHVTYADYTTGEEKKLLAPAPVNLVNFQPGTLFRYFETKNKYSFIRGFKTNEDFAVFNR